MFANVCKKKSQNPAEGRSVGFHFVCALRSDATLACFGDDARGRASPPGASNVSAGTYLEVSAGGRNDSKSGC